MGEAQTSGDETAVPQQRPDADTVAADQRQSARRPTIRDVAVAAGVSVGTASKALNGQGKLRRETIDRVLRAAEQLGFAPNTLAQALLAGRTFTVGLITTDTFGRFSIPVMLGAEDALGAGRISRAVAHRAVDEIWYVLAGQGQMWRRQQERQETVPLRPGTCVSIPSGTHFQFRSDGDGQLAAVGVTMPPWPGDDEAYDVPGKWPADAPGVPR